jgi:glycosyltransferase involved in cell wall biosynthesis
MHLSVILIARDEATNLPDCLASVAFADEVVVVEHGSADNTADLARSLGARVIQTPDWPGFGAQKNRALDAAHGRWVLSIDADERVSPGLAQEILAGIQSVDAVTGAANDDPSSATAFELPRRTQFCGQWIDHCGWSPDPVLRVFRRGAARFSDDWVHERVVLAKPEIRVLRLAQALLHFSYPTPEHYWRKLQRYSQDWARQRYAAGQTTSMARAALSGTVAFVRSYILRLGFLDGSLGFAVCALQAQAAFGKYFELYCLNRLNRADGKNGQSHRQ